MLQNREAGRAMPFDLDSLPPWCTAPTSCTAFRLVTPDRCCAAVSLAPPSISNEEKLNAYVEFVGHATNSRHRRTHGLPLAVQEAGVAPGEAWLWKVHADPAASEKLAF